MVPGWRGWLTDSFTFTAPAGVARAQLPAEASPAVLE